jgi:hypothetical protein
LAIIEDLNQMGGLECNGDMPKLGVDRQKVAQEPVQEELSPPLLRVGWKVETETSIA